MTATAQFDIIGDTLDLSRRLAILDVAIRLDLDEEGFLAACAELFDHVLWSGCARTGNLS